MHLHIHCSSQSYLNGVELLPALAENLMYSIVTSLEHVGLVPDSCGEKIMETGRSCFFGNIWILELLLTRMSDAPKYANVGFSAVDGLIAHS